MMPDERVFQAHIEQGPFQNGVERKQWRLISIEWPYVLIGVGAAKRERGPAEYVLRFECSNYPQTAPTAQLWDVEHGCSLAHERWPTGHKRVPLVFKPEWNSGQCLYLPCDRIAFQGHGGWQNKYPTMIWTPASDITLYLQVVYELLNSNDYTGPRRP